ncbi:MAG TPA: ATP-binding protein, partial [Pirellulaceae bacterium]|nr:ATP-binding protein [Pirellulaceae bacterium]
DLQQFAYVASHDLQEPLRAVAGYCQLLETRLQDNSDEDVQTFLAHATEGAKRMQALINSLLDYARVESRGKEFSHVDVHDVLNEAMANLSVAIEECAAEVTCDEMPSVLGDRDQLVRLFQNLIGNSIKFRRDEAPRIRVNAQANMNHWHFSVSDNGIGLEQQYADRIFVIFQRLHTRTKYPGTGLGLAITKRIVERHGGRMWVESQPGVGSTFFFTLPRNASH